jgi:hypothetical protein
MADIKDKARKSAVKPKANYDAMSRDELKKLIKQKLQDGTSEGKDWDQILAAVDKKGKAIDVKEVAKAKVEPETKAKAAEARKTAAAKVEAPKATKPVKPRQVSAPIEALDDLPEVLKGPAGKNAQIDILQEIGALPQEANPLTGQVQAPQAPQAPTAAPKAAANIGAKSPRLAALGAKLGPLAGKLGAGAAAVGSRLMPLAKGTGIVGAALGARELAHYAAPETAGRVEDFARSAIDKNPLNPMRPQQTAQNLVGAFNATNPGNVGPQLRQAMPSMQDLAGLAGRVRNMQNPLAGGGYGAVEAMHQGAEGVSAKMRGVGGSMGDVVARMAGPSIPNAPGPAFGTERGQFPQNDALVKEMGSLANQKVEKVKAETVAPQRQASVTQKISQAKSRPAKAVLKTSPARQQAKSMFNGLPQELQARLGAVDFGTQPMQTPQPQPSPLAGPPVDFAQQFSQGFFDNPGMNQDRMAWLNERPSGLNVQEQTNQKPNPLLRALGSLRRSF